VVRFGANTMNEIYSRAICTAQHFQYQPTRESYLIILWYLEPIFQVPSHFRSNFRSGMKPKVSAFDFLLIFSIFFYDVRVRILSTNFIQICSNIFVQSACIPTIEKMECHYSSMMCSNPICNYTQLGRQTLNISFGCTLVKMQQKLNVSCWYLLYITKGTVEIQDAFLCIKLCFKNLFKSGKKYKSGVFDITVDLCDVLNGSKKNSLLNLFVPNYFESFKNFFNSCPYGVSILVSILQCSSNNNLLKLFRVNFMLKIMWVVCRTCHLVSIFKSTGQMQFLWMENIKNCSQSSSMDKWRFVAFEIWYFSWLYW
jgi:Protein of unknown function (DUF1091)